MKLTCYAILFLALCFFLTINSYASIIDNGDNTITDTSTGYIWQKFSSDKVNRVQADTYVMVLKYKMGKNWRAPTNSELLSIIPYIKQLPSYKEGMIYFLGDGAFTSDTGMGITSSPEITYYLLTGPLTGYVHAILNLSGQGPKQSLLTLNKGWNLFSTPLTLIDSSPSGFIKDFQDKVRVIWGWDNGIWKIYKPDTIVQAVTPLTSIEPGKGYWIYVNEDILLTIKGASP